MRKTSKLSVSFGLIICLVLLTGCEELITETSSSHLPFGNPSNATPSTLDEDNYLMVKPQFALSYNKTLGRPNWVSWELNNRWLGEAERQNDFRPDPELPQDWEAVTPNDYRRSGFDRGHMVPSADRTRTELDNSATFVMTNIIPQSPDNNQGPWRDLEEDCRDWVEAGKKLYIVAGSYGKKKRIAKGKVTPPYRVWKTILVLDQNQSISSVDENTPIIAVDMPNKEGIRSDDWRKYQVTVNKIESKTGYNLFSELSEDIQDELEGSVNRVFAGKS